MITSSPKPFPGVTENNYAGSPFLSRSGIQTQPFHPISPHDDVITWKHFLRYWPFVRGIHRPPVDSPNKGHWRGALMFSSICACPNGWTNTLNAGDLRQHRAHYDVSVMTQMFCRTVLLIPMKSFSRCDHELQKKHHTHPLISNDYVDIAGDVYQTMTWNENIPVQ